MRIKNFSTSTVAFILATVAVLGAKESQALQIENTGERQIDVTVQLWDYKANGGEWFNFGVHKGYFPTTSHYGLKLGPRSKLTTSQEVIDQNIDEVKSNMKHQESGAYRGFTGYALTVAPYINDGGRERSWNGNGPRSFEAFKFATFEELENAFQNGVITVDNRGIITFKIRQQPKPESKE